MSKFEEVSSKQVVLIDSFEAKMNHLRVLAFSLLIISIYSLYLWFVCSTPPGVWSGLLLFGSQITIGFPAIRAFYELGIVNKEKLHFIDPPTFDEEEPTHEVDIHLGEIPLIFEKLDLQIRKYDDGSLDDLSDLAWFGILVWAAVSSTLFYFDVGGFPLCFAGTLVLILTCFGSYFSGYWIRREFGFEDDLSHLQYFVETRFRNIDASIAENNYRLIVQLLERRRSLVVVDFSILIHLGKELVLRYHLGFPSSEKERITVKADIDVLNSIYGELIKSQIISENNWCTELVDTPTNPSVTVINESSDFSVSKRTSYVSMPSIVDDSSKATAQTFLEVLTITNKNRSV